MRSAKIDSSNVVTIQNLCCTSLSNFFPKIDHRESVTALSNNAQYVFDDDDPLNVIAQRLDQLNELRDFRVNQTSANLVEQ